MSEAPSTAEPRVAIIGGGLAGVATCKALTCRGIPCTLFERQHRVGGLWVGNYPGACVQAPRQQYEFPDATFPTPAARTASAAEVLSYCEAYVREWELERHLRLGTHVERVAQQPGGGFVVMTRPVGDSSAAVAREEFTHVVVCTGMFSTTGNRPDFPGLSGFDGLLLHSSERRDDAAEMSGKRVMVIGAGKSAQDAAAAAVRAGAASVVLAMRRPHLMTPFRICGVPYQWISANPTVHALLEYPGRGPRSPIGRAARTVTAPVRGFFWRSLKAVMLLQHRLPRRLWVSGSLEQEMLGVQGVSVCAEGFVRVLRSGAIDVRVAEVATVGAASVTLRHTKVEGRRAGTEEEFPVDTLVLATGFEDCYSFLDDDIQGALHRQPDGLPLYRHIVPPSLPHLLFVGRAVAFAGPLTMAAQAAWVGELVRGRVTLPAVEAMHAETERWSDATAAARLSSARRHLVLMHGERYSQELLRDMGAGHLALYGGPFGPIANAVIPQHAESFRNAVQPPGVRQNRRLKPPLWLKAATVAVLAGAARMVRGRS